MQYHLSVDRAAQRRRLQRRRRGARFEEVARVLRLYGFELARIRGSHHVFVDSNGVELVIPLRRPTVLTIYVDAVLKATEGKDDES
jgi:predicted RNA binding protein YcfA (HicA-like mRNA interferase family)